MLVFVGKGGLGVDGGTKGRRTCDVYYACCLGFLLDVSVVLEGGMDKVCTCYDLVEYNELGYARANRPGCYQKAGPVSSQRFIAYRAPSRNMLAIAILCLAGIFNAQT